MLQKVFILLSNFKYSDQNNFERSYLPTKNDKNQQNNLQQMLVWICGKPYSWLRGTQISAATMGKSLEILKKLKINLIYGPNISVIGICP